jgi:protein O-mannosyl-transferase
VQLTTSLRLVMNEASLPKIALVCVVLILVVISWQGLSGPFVFDDLPNLMPIGYETPPNYTKFIFTNESGLLGRSISMMTFALNHFLRGGFSNFDLKLTNLAIHVANGLLLYFLAFHLFARSTPGLRSKWLAFFVSALWLLSPLNVGVVFYVIQRMALLACFFTFIGLLSYVLWRKSIETPGGVKKYYLLICAVSWPLAFLSKENGILLPFLIMVIEFGFYSTGRSFQVLRLFFIATLTVACAGVYIFQNHDLLNYADRDFNLLARISTQPIVIVHYVVDLVLPINTDVGLFNDDFPVYRTPWNGATIVSTVLIALGLIFCLFARTNSPNRAVATGAMFFFAAHSIESSVLPLEIYFEHRNYLPSAGLYIAIVSAIYLLFRNRGKFRIVAVVLAIASLCLFTFMSYHKSRAWSSWPQVVTNSYQHHPTSSRAGLEMASLLLESNNIDVGLQVNSATALHNPKKKLNIKLQRFFLLCRSGKAVDDSEYADLTGLIYPGNSLGTATAFEVLSEAMERDSCPNIDSGRLMNRISAIVDTSLNLRLVTTQQAWHVDYFIIEYDRTHGRLNDAKIRLQKSLDGGNLKAEYYRQDVFEAPSSRPERITPNGAAPSGET